MSCGNFCPATSICLFWPTGQISAFAKRGTCKRGLRKLGDGAYQLHSNYIYQRHGVTMTVIDSNVQSASISRNKNARPKCTSCMNHISATTLVRTSPFYTSLFQRTAKLPAERGHVKNVKNRQKVSKIFSTLFDNFRAGQKTSKIVKKCQNIFRHFSTIFPRHHFSGPSWGAPVFCRMPGIFRADFLLTGEIKVSHHMTCWSLSSKPLWHHVT